MIVTRCLPMGIICNLWFEKYIPLLHKSDDYHHRHQLLEYFREWDFFLCTTGYMNTLLVCLFSLSNVICNFRGWPRKWKTRLLSSLIQQHDMTYTQTCFMFVLLVLALIFFAIAIIISWNPAFKIIMPCCNIKHIYVLGIILSLLCSFIVIICVM